MTDARKYSEAEVRAIIERALAKGASGPGELSHADLLAVGEQVGVSAEAMTKAAEEVRAAELERAATGAITSRRRRWLWVHAAVFAVLNGLMFAVNAATTPGEWWALFPVFFWGLALLLHAALTFALPPPPRALERERRRLGAGADAGATRVTSRLRVGDSAETEPEQAASEASTVARADK